MASLDILTEKANMFLATAVPIPGAPLWDMAKVKFQVLDWQGSFDRVQTAIDYLADKVRAQQLFTENEKEFLKEVFEAFGVGGSFAGFPEAAKLASHYVHGEGKPLRINEAAYQSSVIVKDAMTAMKDFIRATLSAKGDIGMVSSVDRVFWQSPQFRSISKLSGRDVNSQGYIQSDGMLLVEQNNSRLFYTDHRFSLQAYSLQSIPATMISTRWRVDSIYDFESFEKKPGDQTKIPLGEGKVLIVPDGLSHYMVVIGIANEFSHYAEWHETWRL